MPVPEHFFSSAMQHDNSPLRDETATIRPQLRSVQQRIAEQSETPDPVLAPVLAELTARRGKMLRPALLLLCGKLVADLKPEHIDLAAIVELIHMASLLHDDVIDKAQLRRGKPSANALWGNTVAVLLGDFLLSRAFTLASHAQLNGAAAVLGQTTQALCVGEIKQNLFKGRLQVTEQEYFEIIEAKTAALFGGCCQLGGLCSGGSEQQVAAFREFGFRFGLAFQVADDLRDVLSSEAQEGKTLGTDLQEGKLTLPVIHWLRQDPAQRQARIAMLTTMTQAAPLAEQLRQAGSIDYALAYVRTTQNSAKHALERFDATPEKDALLALTDRISSNIQNAQ
jgi:octaprenyl-diphosphate synthase